MASIIAEPRRKALGVKPDEQIMTLQVGLVGIDGIVLAGDKRIIEKHYRSGQYGSDGGVAVTSQTSKIKIDDESQIAIAWARDNVAETIADDILKNLKVLSNPGALGDLANASYRSVYPEFLDGSPSTGTGNIGELLIITPARIREILYLEINALRCVTRSIEDKIFAGDVLNTACYFVERFFDARLRVDSLALLAAHSILEAGELSPMTVKGLEIVTCTKAGLSRFTEDQIDSLIGRSKHLHSQINKILTC